MKTKIIIYIGFFLLAINLSAQIDRSVQPKPDPAPKLTLEVPAEFQLTNGLKVLVMENHKLPRVSYTLKIDNKPVSEGNKVGVSAILSSMLANGTTTISKDDFNEEIGFLGADLNIYTGGASASTLTQYAERILLLLADGVINPLLTEEEFNKQKDILKESLKTEENDVNAIANRLSQALTYGINHPYGEFITSETLDNITFSDVKAFYQQRFLPENAYFVVVGDVDYKTIKSQIEAAFNNWKNDIDVSINVPEASDNVPFTQINFVNMPNAVQSEIAITNTINLEMNDPDYHAALIANKILGGGFNSYLNMNLREAHGYTYGARSNINADKYIGRFYATTAVRNAVTDSAVVESLKEINRIKNELVSPEDLQNAKAKYVGDFVLALENHKTLANYALDIKLHNLPENFYTTYLQKINAVTRQDVQRVANKYFKTENARIVVAGKGSEVIKNLEKTDIPIVYFNKKAQVIDKMEFSKAVPKEATPKTVINNYIQAIGGEENAKSVQTIAIFADVTLKGVPMALKAEVKNMTPNKSSMEMSAEGMGVIMKQKFDGTVGYAEQQGMKTDYTEDQIAENKAEHAIFPELYYTESDMTLENIENVNGTDAYKIKITTGEKPSYRFYAVDSGYLLKTENTTEVMGQTITTTVNFEDYRTVGSVKLPYKQTIMSGPQNINMEITKILINEGVTEDDFK